MMAEMLTGEALLPGGSTLDQLKRTVRLLGPLPAWQMEHLRADPELKGSIAAHARTERALGQR